MKKRKTQRAKASRVSTKEKIPLIEHIYELRRRLFYVVASVAVGSGIAYGFEHQIIDILLRPSKGQQLIYTSPVGGMNFLFSVCLDIGIVLAMPVIIYQLLAFLHPLMKDTTHKFILACSAIAGLVAVAGVVFGYFLGLPSALHFLLHQFTTVQVKPLITVQSYMSFVGLYMFGSALMFQLPLIIAIIHRIKPLRARTLLKYERHFIAGAFIVAFIMNPSPNVVDQILVVIPILIMYQLSIIMVWFLNKRAQPTGLDKLRALDAERQAARAAQPRMLLVTARPLPPKKERMMSQAVANAAETTGSTTTDEATPSDTAQPAAA